MIEHQGDRWRLNEAAITQRQEELAGIQEALETCDDIQVRQQLAQRENHLLIEMETGYRQPVESDEE